MEATEQTIMQQWPYKSYIMNSQKSMWTKMILSGLALKQTHVKEQKNHLLAWFEEGRKFTFTIFVNKSIT